MKGRGVFPKVFAYTILCMALLVCVTVALFSQQFGAYVRSAEVRQLQAAYEPLIAMLDAADPQDFAEVAKQFAERNQSFEFFVEDREGTVVFSTQPEETEAFAESLGAPDRIGGGGEGASVPGAPALRGRQTPDFFYVVHIDADDAYAVIALNQTDLTGWYGGLFRQALGALLVILALYVVAALFFARQITKPMRRLEEEIRKEREMEEAQRYFFAAASHELKTPLAATSALLEGMLENVGDYKDHPKYLRECLRLLDAQNEMLAGILEIVKLNDGRIVPAPEAVRLRGAVDAAVPACRTLAESAGLKLLVDVPEDAVAQADPVLLDRVLSNVLLNAVQNTPPGGEVRVLCGPAPEGGRSRFLRLSVLNTGARIDEALLPRLSDPFSRADKARSRTDGRSGLGLTIVQKTLDVMGIPFALENTEEGVLFRMDLPAR